MLQQMDSQPRPVFYTTPTNVQEPKIDRQDSLGSVSNTKTEAILPTNKNNPSGTPKTPTPVNNAPGKSLMRLLSGQQTKQVPTGTANHPSKPDHSFITSRLIVMKTPEENSSDLSSRSSAELVRELLDTQYPNLYMLYSLDQYSNNEPSYRKEFFHNRVLDHPLFDEKPLPPLIALLCFCQTITSYLLQSRSHIVVLHCHDSKTQLAFATCLLLAYHKLYSRADQIIHYYEHYRSIHPLFSMSQKRYIQYFCDLSNGIIERPHFEQLILKTINLSPIPLVNRPKTACRPFIDIYDHEHKKIFSTYQELAKLRVYSAADTTCSIPINCPFLGDLTIHISHATVNTSRRTHEGGIRICELTINSNFSTFNHPELTYLRNDLDGIDSNEKNPTAFRVTLEIGNQSRSSSDRQDAFLKKMEITMKQPLCLFRDEDEFKQKLHDCDKQIKHQNSDEAPVSPSVVIQRSSKGKEDLTSSYSSHSSSPGNTNRLSGSFSSVPLSPSSASSSFPNPLHTLSKFQHETSPRTSQIPSSPLIEEEPKKEQTSVGTLLDLDGDHHSLFTRSISSDKQQHEFHSSLDSQTNLLDDDDDNDKPVLQRILSQTSLPTPMQATRIEKTELKSSILTEQSTTTTTKSRPNDDIDMKTKSQPFTSQPPLSSTKDKSASNYTLKSKVNTDTCFDGLCTLNNDSKPPSPPKPTGIGAALKVTLAKDLDPNVVKVREWTEGKKRNIRALLCSLLSVTWPECRWGGCQMNELLTPEQVKKVYRKAVLHIHPDKLYDDPNLPLAKLIFVELNEAWSQFEREN